MLLAGATEIGDGLSLLDDPTVTDRLADIEVDLCALEVSVLRALSSEMAGSPAGREAATLKIEGSLLQQRISTLALTVLGEMGALATNQEEGNASVSEAAGWVERHLFRRAVTIYGGSNEIQKNIIAKAVLGL